MSARATRIVALGTAALAYVALVGIAAVAGGDGAVSSADQRAYEERGAWFARGELHIGGHPVALPGPPITAGVGYTSEGALVYDPGERHDAETDSITSGDASLTLVTPSGELRPLTNRGVAQLDLLPGTDPSLPYAAFTRGTGQTDSYELVLVDVRDGSEQVVGEPFVDEGGSGYYPVVLGPEVVTNPSGGLLDWRTGKSVPEPESGRYPMHWTVGPDAVLVRDPGTNDIQVLDRVDGHELLRVPDESASGIGYPTLSVDGRWLGRPEAGGFLLTEVATGRTRTFGADWALRHYGWTPDGHVVGITETNEIVVCSPDSGECHNAGLTLSSPTAIFDVPSGAFLTEQD